MVSGFDIEASRKRCLKLRRRLLDISQTVGALHIGGTCSALELVEGIYFGLMRKGGDGRFLDSFIMSKGHGCITQYLILEELGILSKNDLETYCKPGGRLGGHPDYGTPGIEASTGALGHGLTMAVGMAYADQETGNDRITYVVLSDGEMQEGSVWEALMLAPNVGVRQLVGFLDLNDFQSLGRVSELHPNFYPIVDKIRAFGWETVEINGHDGELIQRVVRSRRVDRPLMVVAKTIKGKGFRFMEGVPIWHYRSPSPQEYQKALQELYEVRE